MEISFKSMEILYLTQKYSKDNHGIQNDLIEALASQNNHLNVVSVDNQINNKYSVEILGNINIYKKKSINLFPKNFVSKALAQFMLPYRLNSVIKKYLKLVEIDFIIYATPPISMYKTLKYCKKRYKAITFLALKDIFPQNAIDLNILTKKSIITKYYKYEEKKLYRLSDFIGCMTKNNIEYMKKEHPDLSVSKLLLFPNTIKSRETHLNFALFNESILRVMQTKSKKFFFGGNLGKPQKISILLDVINYYRNHSQIDFIIAGDGTEASQLKSFIEKNNVLNVHYFGRVSSEMFHQLIMMSDIGIVTLDERFTIPNFPERFLHFLSLGKPILAATDDFTDIKRILQIDAKCGVWISSAKSEYIIGEIQNIVEDKYDLNKLGSNGLEYYLNNYKVEYSVMIIDELFKMSR